MEEYTEAKSKFVDATTKQTDLGYSYTPNILVNNVVYNSLSSYLRNLRKSGLDEIKAIRLIIQKRGIEVVGLFKNNGNKRNLVYLGKLSIDDEGYPTGIRFNKEARRSYISLQKALTQQGNPKEIFINYSKYHYFCTAKRIGSINSFLNYANLKPSQMRIISYTGMANPCRIEIMERGKQFNSGKLLETLDIDSQGCPIGLSKGKQKFSLLELLVQQGKIDCKQLFKNKVLKDSQSGFYLRGITYNCVGVYKAYQEEFGIGKITELEIKENESSINIMGRTKNSKGREKKVLNRMYVDKDRKPLLIPLPNQKSLSLLKILFLQNQIDPERYHTFKDKHHYKARAKYKTEQEIITELVERTKHQGGKANNTAFALRKYCIEGGDASLYYACRKWNIDLPKKCRINLPKKKYTPWIEPIISYLADVYSSHKPTEKEACYLISISERN